MIPKHKPPLQHHLCTCVCVCVHACACVSMCTSLVLSLNVCVCLSICARVCLRACVCVCVTEYVSVVCLYNNRHYIYCCFHQNMYVAITPPVKKK